MQFFTEFTNPSKKHPVSNHSVSLPPPSMLGTTTSCLLGSCEGLPQLASLLPMFPRVFCTDCGGILSAHGSDHALPLFRPVVSHLFQCRIQSPLLDYRPHTPPFLTLLLGPQLWPLTGLQNTVMSSFLRAPHWLFPVPEVLYCTCPQGSFLHLLQVLVQVFLSW